MTAHPKQNAPSDLLVADTAALLVRTMTLSGSNGGPRRSVCGRNQWSLARQSPPYQWTGDSSIVPMFGKISQVYFSSNQIN